MPTQFASESQPNERHSQILLASLVAVFLVFVAVPSPPSDAAEPFLEPCRLDDVPEEVLCIRHEVFEDRLGQEGRKIALKIAVLPALSQKPAPDPLFLLAGGPGQAATDLGAMALSTFHKVRSQRDIVLVDLRGTGESNALDCNFAADVLAGLSGEPLAGEDLEACLDSLDADARYYTTDLAIDDLDEVRQRLGYERINLWGGSYGTRAALVYLERHPESIRSVILDGVAPYSLKLPLFYARDGQRALDLLLADCAADENCRTTFPTLSDDLDDLLTELEAHPVSITALHPRSGEEMTVAVTAGDFAGNLRNFLYTPSQASLLPFIIDQASQGNFAPYIAASLEVLRWSIDSMSVGFTLSVLCSEDLPRITAEEATAAVDGTFLGNLALETWTRMCDRWPRGQLPAKANEPHRSDAPALLLSGRLDPVTPPSWGEEIAASFPNSRHLVVPGAAHNTGGSRCVQQLMADFIAAGSAADLETDCIETIQRPPFVTGLSGSAP